MMDLPRDITVKHLQLICNSILKQDETVPYAFFIDDKEITENLDDCLEGKKFSSELVVDIAYQEQAVFKVRPITRCSCSLPGHAEAVISVQFSPDSRKLASGSGDTTVRFWDLDMQTSLHTCQEKLIEAIRPYKILYDTSHADYMKSKLKNDLWDKIADDLELKNGELAKDTWTKLRCCHRDALRRQKKCFKSGVAAETIKQWKFQKQMSFLLPYMTNRKREANLVDSGDEDSATPKQNEILDVGVGEESENNNQESSVMENENDLSNKNNEDRDIVFKEPQNKMMKKNDIGNLIQQLY